MLQSTFSTRQEWESKMRGMGPVKPETAEEGSIQGSHCKMRAGRNQRDCWFSFPLEYWLLIWAYAVVFGRISVMDNPSNPFSISLRSCVGMILSVFSTGNCYCFPVPCCLFWMHVWTWIPEDIMSLLVPKQCLCFTTIPEKEVQHNLVNYRPVWITHSALPTSYCCLTCWKSVRVLVFSARRAVMGEQAWRESVYHEPREHNRQIPLSPPLQHR